MVLHVHYVLNTKYFIVLIELFLSNIPNTVMYIKKETYTFTVQLFAFVTKVTY